MRQQHIPLYGKDEVVWFVSAPYIYLGDKEREAVLDGRMSTLPPWDSHFTHVSFKQMLCTGHVPDAFDSSRVGSYSFINCELPHETWRTWQPHRQLPSGDAVPWMIIQDKALMPTVNTNTVTRPPLPVMTDLRIALAQLRNEQQYGSGVAARLAASRYDELCDIAQRDCPGVRVNVVNNYVSLQ